MSTGFQVTFDAADPAALGGFWAGVLGYVEAPPPEGFATWDMFLDAVGVPRERRGDGYAIVDPEGTRPRLYFERVPEGKTAKNRVHLDVEVSEEASGDDRRAAVDAAAERLSAVGATRVRGVAEFGSYFVVMKDPEGNEFCLV